MRPAALLLLVLMLPLVPPTATAATAPELLLSLPILFEFVTPGRTETIDGVASFTFASDASCPDAVTYGFHATKRTAGLRVRILTENGTIPSAEVRGGAVVERAVRIAFDVDNSSEAYSRLDASVRLQTGACGTVDANQTTVQVGSRVAFAPKVELTLVSETSLAWRVRATNLANAGVRLPWVTRQPALGRVLVGGTWNLDGPGSTGMNQSVELNVAKGNLDIAHDVLFDAQIAYDGNYPYRTDERPAVGTASLRIHEGPKPKDADQSVLQYTVLALAVLVVVGGVVLGRRMRRGRGP